MLSVCHCDFDGLVFQFIPEVQKGFDGLPLVLWQTMGEGADPFLQNSALFT